MAAITSAQSGNWSSTSTWTGGVVPVDGDSVTISSGHTVTFDVDQSGFASGLAGLTVTGILDASTTAGSYYLKMAANITGAGTLSAGSNSTAYPTNCTFTIAFSTTTTGVAMVSGAVTLYASYPTISSVKLSANASANDTVLNVDTDISGSPLSTYWANGATLHIDAASDSISSEERTFSSATSSTITITSGLTGSKIAGSYVHLMSRNVKVIGLGATSTSTAIRAANAVKNYYISAEIRNFFNGFSIYGNYTISITYSTVCKNGLTGTGKAFNSFGNASVSNCIFSNLNYSADGIWNTDFSNCVFSALSAGAFNSVHKSYVSNSTFSGNYGTEGLSFSNTYANCTMQYCSYAFLQSSSPTLIACNITNTSTAFNGVTSGRIIDSSISTSGVALTTNNNNYNILVFASNSVIANASIPATTPSVAGVFVTDINQTPGAYKAWLYSGTVTTQSTTKPDGFSASYQHAMTSNTGPVFWQTDIRIRAYETLSFTAYFRKDVSMSYLPRLWLFKQGYEPEAYSSVILLSQVMTDSTNTWETYGLSYQNSTAYDQVYTIRFLTKNASGNAYTQLYINGAVSKGFPGMLVL